MRVAQFILLLAVSTAYAADPTTLISVIDSPESLHALQDSLLPTIIVYTTVIDCAPCISLFPKLIRGAEYLNGMVDVATVDCEQQRALCAKAGVRTMPYIHMLPARKQKNPYTGEWQKLPVEYTGALTARDIVDTALAMLPEEYVLSQIDSSASLARAIADAHARFLPAVVLLSTKDTVAPLFRAVATALQGRAVCIQVSLGVDVGDVLSTGETRPAIVLVGVDGHAVQYDGELSAPALKAWLVPPRVPEMAKKQRENEAPAEGAASAGRGGLMVPVWTGADLGQRVEQPGLAVLAMVQGSTDGCIEQLRPFSEAVLATKGLLITVAAAVNLSTADHALIQEYVPELAHVWEADPCNVRVVLMPDEEDKGSEAWPLYSGSMEGKALQAWAVELFPNLVTRLSADGLNGFLTTLHADVPKVLLVTNKEETPAMFKALAYNMRDFGLMFADVMATPEVKKKLSVPKAPMVLLAVVAETDDQGRDLHGRGFRMEPYGGPLQYMYLSMFLLQRAQALGVAPKSAHDEDTVSSEDAVDENKKAHVVQLLSQEDFEASCTTKLGVCVLAALDTQEPEHDTLVGNLVQAATRLAADPVHFMWYDARRFGGFTHALGGSSGAGPQVFLLAPGKRRVKLMGAGEMLVTDTLASTVKNMLAGKGTTVPLHDLPQLKPDDTDVDEDLPPVEEEFDLTEILEQEVESLKTRESMLKEAEEALKNAGGEQQKPKKKKKKKKKKKATMKDEL